MTLRREFLKRAGLGLSGGALAALAGGRGANAAGPPDGAFAVKAFGAKGDGKSTRPRLTRPSKPPR
jgi:hypothetical protein